MSVEGKDAQEPSLEQTLAEERARVAAVCREIGTSGLAPGSAGNVSARVDDRTVITPRGCRLRVATPDELVVLGLDGQQLNGTRGASSEQAIHLGIYAQTEAGGVVHTHSHFATVMSTLVTTLPAVHYSIAGLGGEVRVASYATFGSDELAGNVLEALEGRFAVLLRNHGAVTIGPTAEIAMERAFTLEWLCSLAFHAHLYGRPTLVSADELERVRQQSRRLDYGLDADR